MKLKNAMMAAALGGTILSAVPAVVPTAMLTAAYACDDQSCQEEPEDIPIDVELPPVEIFGSGPEPAVPAVPPGGGSVAGGSGPGVGVRPVAPPQRVRQLIRCFRNDKDLPQHATQQITYTTAWQYSANASADAVGVLSVELGVQFNTGVQNQYSVDVNLPPGTNTGIYVEYEQTEYEVRTYNSWTRFYTSEWVTVSRPTLTVVMANC